MLALKEKSTSFGLFLKEIVRRYVDDETSLSASSLAYIALLSVVPVMSVLVTVFSALPMFEQTSQDIQDFVFENFVPSTGAVIQEYISGFVSKARGLTVSMSLAVIVTSILMMSTMEKALNRIFDTKPSGNFMQKITMYWAVLTMGPLLIGGGIALTSIIFKYSALAGVKALLLKALPIIASTIGFFLVYLIVPNRKVKWKSALIGAVLAALFFELAKRGFVWYVATIPSYQKVYGALASIPLFLIWMFLSWNILLIGGTITATLESSRWRKHVQQYKTSQNFLLVLDILNKLWGASKMAQCISHNDIHESLIHVPDNEIAEQLAWLENNHIIERNQSGDYLLLQDLGAINIGELYLRGQFTLTRTTDDYFNKYQPLVDSLWQQLDKEMSHSVEHILENIKNEKK
ncbi:MAG: YihY family inner membrane protein [Proteobacteria bacterium]|nr:YihY family inner membrane protein [Pseudomonadota bacterium]